MAINLCKIRQDLIDDNCSVPVGASYYSSILPLEYRWDNDNFQVKLNGIFQDACSIDWNFGVENEQ